MDSKYQNIGVITGQLIKDSARLYFVLKSLKWLTIVESGRYRILILPSVAFDFQHRLLSIRGTQRPNSFVYKPNQIPNQF